MAESSPGDDGKKLPSSDGSPVVTRSQGHLDSKLVKEDTDSHPIDEDINTGLLQFHTRDSEEECPSFTCVSLPGIKLTLLDWIVCCKPNSEIDGKYVTYHKLTNSDKSLSTIMTRYSKSNIVGLIIINTTNSVCLADDFANKGDIPLIPPVYIVSLDDGEALEEFLRLQEGFIQIKVSSGASLPMDYTGPSSHRRMQKKHTHSKMNLNDLLKEHLYANGERIVVSASYAEFQLIFSCFHNYEAQLKRDPSCIDKAIKLLNVTNVTDELFRRDFLFYLLLAYRFTRHRWVYGNLVNNYVTSCINKFEAITEVQAMTTVLSAFIQMGDFKVQFEHVNMLDAVFKNDNVSVLRLFYHMTISMFKRSTRSNENNGKFIYHKILWIALRVFFGSQINIEPSTLATLWKSDLLNKKVQKMLTFSKEVLTEFSKGFALLKALKLPEGVCFDYVQLAEFLDPLEIKTLYISYITDLMEASEVCFSQSAKQLRKFLTTIRGNYYEVFVNWERYHFGCTKFTAYEEALKFLEYIFSCISELNDEECSKKAPVIDTEIMEWMKLLVNNVNMFGDDALKYLEKLQAKQAMVGFSKKYTAVVNNLIHDRGMKYVKQLPVPGFHKLFAGLNIWKFQFVEEFLNNCFIVKTVSLKDVSWELLLQKINDRFSDAQYKRCIVGLIKRISEAYVISKRQNEFVTDLMRLDVANLFLTQSFKEDDQSIQIVFIEMVCAFIQRNALKEDILSQVTVIMGLVKPGNHLQSLILTAIQKEIIPDHNMIEKLDSSTHLTTVINASVLAACNSLNTLPKLSEADKFYWHFISSCCKLIQPNTENLSKLSKYLFAVDKLGTIFQIYCTTKKINKSVTYEVSQEIQSIPNADLKDYFNWIHKMQNMMFKWRQKFFDEKFNYDDIITYDSNLPIVVDTAKAVNSEHLVLGCTEIADLKKRYSAAYAILSLLLVKGNKEYGWCLFVELLNSYGIKLSNTLQSKLNNHLVISRKDSVTNTNDLQQKISEPNSQLEQESKIHVRLYKSVTLEILVNLVDDLQSFLKPILEQIEFLVYFHLHDCTMFSRHLRSQIVEISAHSEQTGEVPAITLGLPAVSTKQTSSDADERLLQFSIALQKTREFILSLIGGTAKYEDIFFEDSSEESVLKFDAETEFKILCGFPEFKSNEEGKEGIKHMLELVQYSPQISKIPDVCSQYHLDNCMNDLKMKELQEIINSVETAKNRAKITGKIANNYMKRIREILNFSDSSIAIKCLRIFPVVANCAQFYQFIKKKEFMNNRDAFSSQVELITAQLQHGDYDENVLNHLTPAFKYISPFLDTKQSLSELMDKISKLCSEGVGFGCDPTKHFCQLETVNSNITMIQLWFSRAEGDTLENVSKELKWIMEHGHFKLIIRPMKIVYISKIDCGESYDSHSNVFLHFKPQMSSCISETWNNEQIDDFVRKLGFLESQTPDVDQQVKMFQQLSQIAQKYYHILVKLRDLGHLEHVEKEETISCSAEIESAELMVANAEKKLENWKATIRNMYKTYDKLLFFSISKILSLHKILLAADVSSIDKIVHEIGFLFKNDPEAIRKLKTAVKTATSTVEATPSQTPFAIVGKFLVQLCNDSLITNHFLFSRSQLSKGTSFKEMIHFAPNYDNGQLLRLLIQIYNGVPESFEMFQCDKESTEEDLKLFLSRASKFRSQTFTILGINILPYELQELILQHHSQEAEQTMESTSCLHYIATASSILHEMPWIEVKQHKESGPDLKWDDAKQICYNYVNKGNVNFDLALVYGCAGNGKTYYIKKQLYGQQQYLIIAVNESFTPLNAILKLRSLPRDKCCKVYFNFTIVMFPHLVATYTYVSTSNKVLKNLFIVLNQKSTVDKKLMNTLAWFFFKLLIFEYMEDLETGITFRLPGGYHWKIFVEVPSLHADTQDNLDWIYKEIPIFKLLGKPVLIKKERSYDIDSSVQLVCKYLNAYEKRTDEKRGINKLYASGQEVNFGNDPIINNDQCHNLLKKYMQPYIADNKVLQQLFIKYMERRCKFMQKYPGFCYNTGAGVLFNHKQVNENELKKMVENKRLVKSKDTYYSNAKRLGELLMETMLQEVHEFCKIDIQQNWGAHAHQQLIYEVKDGGGTIQLLTLKPDEISAEKTMKFVEVIGVEIPTMTQLLSREKLDSYLSSALGVPLKDRRLQDIDDAKYVLTLDYTVKMLNIHERRECGVPVIIKGETGVGKTALINMLSKLWNHALISEWRAVKRKIIKMLYNKSLEFPNSNLHTTLKQLCDSELNSTDKHLTEEELIPLMELYLNSDTTPYFKFVNEKLLQIRDSDSILELLDVDDETKGDVTGHHRRLSNFSNEENSIVNLISKGIETSSAQATAKLLCKLLKGKLISTFYKLNIHAALSPKEIQEFFIPIIKMANHLIKIHKAKQQQGTSELPVVTVFLDEVNTSSCMGLFKEIIIDKSFDGEPLPTNIFLVAACNPHRGNSSVFHENKKEETWIRGSYYVQKLHPTMRFVMWDYGSLNDEQELAYVRAKMVMANKSFNIAKNVELSELIVECQKLMRDYAYEHLGHFGLEDSEAKPCAASCVSQRDIQRVFTFYEWISKTYEMLQKSTTTETQHPVISKGLSPEEMRHCALLVALGLVYYMRLNSEYRERFTHKLDKINFAIKFLTAFTQEMDFYTNELSLPTGIAKTEALKENLFATIICTVTKTPLIIVGAPGSSKTLSFNLAISNLKGPESKQKLFRNTEVFKSLDPQYYQCSRRTTSTEIETVFQRAINRQRSHESFSMPIRCVVFMDEAGLPEESHESLKVLHYHLDQQEVAFVAITNHILDAAKTNRAVSLFRPTASQRDLEILAKGCLCATPEKPPPELKGSLTTIVKFCSAYCTITKDKCIERFFGLRDFIHFINYIRREGKLDVTPKLVLRSLERNFNGTKEFEDICKVFLKEMGAKLDPSKQRNIIEILWSSLNDKQLPSNNDTQNEVRYKLIIDPSEDESITRLLFMFGILNHENTRTYVCSDFLGDGQLQKINTIAAIRHSAVAGHTVIMSQTDDIHESFYDLFNLNFRRIDDPEAGSTRYFTNIAIGAHLKPSKVDLKFQCIVVVKESEIKNTPAAFLNRFEKYFISHENLLNLVFDKLPSCLKEIANVVYKKVQKFYSLLDPNSFYGGNEATVCSLMLSILPRPGHQYKAPKSFVTFESSSNKVLLLQNVVKYLHELGGFYFTENSVEELEHDANCILGLLATTGSEFSGVMKNLESCDATVMFQWIIESLSLIYTVEEDSTQHDDEYESISASDGACMVTAVITQWILRFLCKKLMQLMTPEAAILKRKCIPISYFETYLNYQTHFSIKELIKKQSEMLSQCNDDKVATKLICYTRSTSSIHQLPAVFPRTSAEELQQSKNCIENLICEKADDLFLCKLSSISSQTAFKSQLQAFETSQQQTVFVLVINMQETSHQIINHIRIMIEEVECTRKIKKLYVLLLHFPAMMFYDPCYRSLFLCGWDHYYLDAIDQIGHHSLVDIREWFRQSCLTSKEFTSQTEADDSMLQSLLLLLSEPESILIIASRIILNIDSNELSLDSSSDIAVKVCYLNKLLFDFDKKVAKSLCLKFKSYWKPSVMGDHLEEAAKFSKSRESTLNVSDYVDSVYRSTFFNFIAYMIYQISKSCSLDILLRDNCERAMLNLFWKLLDAYPIPKLAEIKAFNNTWDCRVHTTNRTGYMPQFPFFMKVSAQICNIVEGSMAEINNDFNILQEKSSSLSVGSCDPQSKEQIFEKLYKHSCAVTIKEKQIVEEEYLSTTAVKEMGNDEVMWQKYCSDFIHYYLHLYAAPDSLEHRVLQLTLTNTLTGYSKMKPIAVHCYLHLFQLDIAKVVVSLKSIRQLQVLELNQQLLYQKDAEASLVIALQASKSTLDGSSISNFIRSISKFLIDLLFEVLINSITCKDNRLASLQKWFIAYRDMMSMASLKSTLAITAVGLNEQLKAQCHLMEVTFLTLLYFHDITLDAVEYACTLACYLHDNFFTDDLKFKSSVPLNLKQMVIALYVMLQNSQFIKLISVPQFYQCIMEGLFTHFFPDTNDPTCVYSKEDVEFFLTFANDQSTLKDVTQPVDQYQNLICFSKLKFYLDRILCKGWNENEIYAKPANFYKLETCICVGQTILSQCQGANLSEYIPLYLQEPTKKNQNNPLMKQRLMHLYFNTVLEKLQIRQFTPSQLLTMITETEQKSTEIVSSDAVKLVAVVEKQALLEVLLQAIANNLESRNDFQNLLSMSDQLNSLIKDESHHNIILLMHLMKKYHGLKSVLSLLDKKSREPLNCLKSINENLKDPPPSTSHQFPFVMSNPTAKCDFTKIYREICDRLQNVAGGSSKKFLHYVNSIIKGNDKTRSSVRMMIWLCVYYEFYCTKKTSPELIDFFNQAQEDLGLSKEHLNILSCFLDPSNMIKEEETQNPVNLNAEIFEYTKEGNIVPKKPPSDVPKRDPIWEFFNPDEDPCDIELRHALANMVAVVFGIPDKSTHLWYHMFSPKDLENSYMTGFMYPSVVKNGGLMYDCGCELNEDGYYGRSDYDTRDTLSLHSWYLLLWCNFGAFCVGLLTQPRALEQIKGHVLSDWMSIRHYCMAQLSTVWLHMRINMSLGDEERSFFIMRSMHQLFMLFQEDAFPHPQGIFVHSNELTEYEKTWHECIYKPSKLNLKNELENHSSDSVWALPILKKFRTFELHYPHPATKNDYMQSLTDTTEANDCNSTHLFVLHQFVQEEKKLQKGGALLPDLVEFYQWIHTELSYLVTYQKAEQISIGKILSLSSKRYSQKYFDHLTDLFKRVKNKYNDYLGVNGGNIGPATCNRAAKPTDVHYINEDTRLIKFISLEDINKDDWLYIVLMDVIENHNTFLRKIFTHAKTLDCHYKKYLPDKLPELLITEVTDQSCIVPSNGTDENQFLNLINSHYIYNDIYSIAKFDLNQLEQDVVKFYIAGKPLITFDSNIRTVFRFKIPGSKEGYTIDLSAIAQGLPENYKEQLNNETSKRLEIGFHAASYHMFTEIVDGLRIVMRDLVQYIIQRKDKGCDPTLNVKLVDYVKKLFDKDHQLLDEIGIKSISDAQRKLLGDVEMKRLFHCLELFVDWLQGGLYDFRSLPILVFDHLKDGDVDSIMEVHTKYSSIEMYCLRNQLDEFEKLLNQAENHLTRKEDLESSIIQVLNNLGLCEYSEKFISLIPKTILVCHYVHFRMTLRKLKITVTTMTHLQPQKLSTVPDQWTEIIEDLWKHLPYFQDEKYLYDDNCLKFDCVKLQYGDQEESENESETWPHQNTLGKEDVPEEVDEVKEKATVLQKFEENPEFRKAVLSLASNPAASSISQSTPSVRGMDMNTEELCQWLRKKKIAEKYIKCFEDEDIDGAVLAAYKDEHLISLGISEEHVRIKIITQFKKLL